MQNIFLLSLLYHVSSGYQARNVRELKKIAVVKSKCCFYCRQTVQTVTVNTSKQLLCICCVVFVS